LRDGASAPPVVPAALPPAVTGSQGISAGSTPSGAEFAAGTPPTNAETGLSKSPPTNPEPRFDDGRGFAVVVCPAWLANRVMTVVLGVCLAITVGFLLFILAYLVFRGVGALDWDFFTKKPAPVGQLGGGMANALYGSFLLVTMASAFAVPVGILTAVFLVEYRSDRLGPVVRFIGELLAGVPSIVIGIFGYYMVVKPMGHFSGWAGAFALGVMMIPIVMRATEEALRLVPASLRHASFALGASHWQTVVKVTLPAALPAIITAVFLSIARVVGETAPLILTAFNNSHWAFWPGEEMPSLPYFIFNYAVSPYEDWHRQAWAAALVLLVVVMVLSFGVRLIAGRNAVSTRQAG
jgi:phosphate transport system permease protein